MQTIATTPISIGISWTNGFDGFSPITGARIDYFDEVNLAISEILNGPNPSSYTIANLMIFTTLNITVFLINDVGTSDPTSIIAQTGLLQ